MGIQRDEHMAGYYQARVPITRAEAKRVAADKQANRIGVVKVEETDDRFWDILNDALFAARPDIYLSVGGFITGAIDLSFLARLPKLRHFGLHGALKVAGIEHLADLPELEHLYLNAFSLTSFDFLEQISPGLRELILGQTRSKKPSLAPLARFRDLRMLYVEGHHREIEVIEKLPRLEELTLRSITVPDLSWVRPLKKLWSLDIKLGGTNDLSSLAGLRNLKYLELWQIRGLDNIEVAAELPGLQFVYLQSLKHVTSLEPLAKLKKLRRIYLENLSSLTTLEPLRSCPKLQEFILCDEKGQWQPEDLIPVLSNRSLRAADVSFWPARKDTRFDELLQEHGKERYEHKPFEYV